MAADNWGTVIARVLQHEGGYVDDPDDNGGATNRGITQDTLSAYLRRRATKDEVKALDVATAKLIYKKQYWDKVAGDDLPAGLDYAAFDFCVHSGPHKAASDLQKELGVVAPDGVIGMKTLAAIQNYDLGLQALIRNYCQHRLRFLKGHSDWWKYKNGWTRRINEVQAAAARMASKGSHLTVADVEPVNDGYNDKASPTGKKLTSSGRAVAAGSSAVGLVGAQASDMAEKLSPYTDTMAIVKYVFIALTFVGLAVTAYMAYNAVKRGQD